MAHRPNLTEKLVHVLSPAEVREWIANAPAKPFPPDRAEVRLYALAVVGTFFYGLLEPAFYAMFVPSAPIHRIGSLAGLHFTVGWFLLCAIATLPHLVSLVCIPSKLHHQLPRKIAGYAAFFAAVLWGRLGTMAYPLDYGLLPWLYWANAGGCIVVAFLCGFSVNAQQLREHDASTAATSN